MRETEHEEASRTFSLNVKAHMVEEEGVSARQPFARVSQDAGEHRGVAECSVEEE